MFNITKIYVWDGLTQSGKACKGKTLVSDTQLLRIKLRQEGIILKASKCRYNVVISKGIKAKELFIFTRQVARLLQAGLPLVQIFELLENNTNNLLLKEFINQLSLYIKNGYSLTEALQKNRPYFSEFHCSLIALGERTSHLELMLSRIAEHMQKNLKIKAALINVLIYPCMVIGVASFVFLALLIGVVPQFEQIFTEVGAQLPFLTRMVIYLSQFIGSIAVVTALFFLIVTVLFIFFQKNYLIVAIKRDQFLVKIPVVKKILSEVITARLSRALATALLSGLPLLDALQAIAGMTKNYVYKNAILSSCKLIQNGESFYQALFRQNILAPEVLQLIKLGEVSASLAEILNNVADMYEEKIDYFVSNLSKLAEPLLIIILGIMIGGLMIAMYLPIFKLGSVI
ncbi:type 4 fimbrial assembly protein [Candidatus Rickettsiella viridis]|uniref:Type 4 fimbrial assembly protein n=1 Tax=Candidatus Rickettsiella viridis TaxID=676208 RepID=A0A2Z5UTQ7_9COXI|nr:type II secretion system F family protein [Candidatus Rickettsiella viridis]BBB14838.1 type 4 fimbrial assembly protein [Candidatus Rickettsiella viridis]